MEKSASICVYFHGRYVTVLLLKVILLKWRAMPTNLGLFFPFP